MQCFESVNRQATKCILQMREKGGQSRRHQQLILRMAQIICQRRPRRLQVYEKHTGLIHDTSFFWKFKFFLMLWWHLIIESVCYNNKWFLSGFRICVKNLPMTTIWKTQWSDSWQIFIFFWKFKFDFMYSFGDIHT